MNINYKTQPMITYLFNKILIKGNTENQIKNLPNVLIVINVTKTIVYKIFLNF